MPGNDRENNRNKRSEQELQSHSDQLLKNKNEQSKKGNNNAANIADLPSIDASTRDLGTVSGVD